MGSQSDPSGLNGGFGAVSARLDIALGAAEKEARFVWWGRSFLC